MVGNGDLRAMQLQVNELAVLAIAASRLAQAVACYVANASPDSLLACERLRDLALRRVDGETATALDQSVLNEIERLVGQIEHACAQRPATPPGGGL